MNYNQNGFYQLGNTYRKIETWFEIDSKYSSKEFRIFQSNRDYSIHQPKGDAAAGNQRAGYLLKRSEGRIRNTWQKRRCQVQDGFLKIFHADESKDPARVNLLTCQMKPSSDDRLCFDVVSYNRTYHFQVKLLELQIRSLLTLCDLLICLVLLIYFWYSRRKAKQIGKNGCLCYWILKMEH